VAAGATATISLTVTNGTSSLTAPLYGTGAVGGSGDIPGSFRLRPAITIASGQSIDLGFTGGGIDDTTTFLVFGSGLSIKAGSLHSDPKITGSLRRFTLDIPAQTNTTLASLWIVKGNNIFPFTGGLVITPPPPVIGGVTDAESARKSFTSGQWVAIYGSNLAGTIRTWTPADFTDGVTPGSPLPSSLDGVSATIDGVPASVYLVSPGQLNVLAPSNLPAGPVSVVVTNNGASSVPFQGTVAQASPSFFYYGAGSKIYPAAVDLNGIVVGDPAISSRTAKAYPGEMIVMFLNGIAPAAGGVVAMVTQFPQQVSISAGGTALTTSAAYLVFAGEFQVNVTLPEGLAPGDYTLSLSVPGGSTADSGLTVTLPVGPKPEISQ
jgi:uncharacterized protein (TIGR03437 family)